MSMFFVCHRIIYMCTSVDSCGAVDTSMCVCVHESVRVHVLVCTYVCTHIICMCTYVCRCLYRQNGRSRVFHVCMYLHTRVCMLHGLMYMHTFVHGSHHLSDMEYYVCAYHCVICYFYRFSLCVVAADHHALEAVWPSRLLHMHSSQRRHDTWLSTR